MIPDNLKHYFPTWHDFQTIIRDDDKLLQFLTMHSLDSEFKELLEYVCEAISDSLVKSTSFYSKELLDNNADAQILCTIVKLFPRVDIPYWRLLSDFFQHKYSAVLSKLPACIERWYQTDAAPVSEADFAVVFLAPFKNAFPGFWDKMYQTLRNYPAEPGVLPLCKAAPVLFGSTDNEELRTTYDELLKVIPNSLVVKELQLIWFYYQKKWGNCAALAEQIQAPFFLFDAELFFYQAWCYGKLKEVNSEIETYEKCIDLWPDFPFALNNLGYAYYKNKQYKKALSTFESCLEQGLDIQLAANNYVRTLIAMRRFSDARHFLQRKEYNVDKKLAARVMNADDVNLDDDNDSSQNAIISEKPIRSNIKQEQFTNERILEDELVERMNAGYLTFGKKLKILRRKGIYGRQFVLSNGKRPDLIAEDDQNNLYIIELKKDSGYDDAYEQVIDYLNWFDKNWKEKYNSITGIICLNNPTKSLVEKVHSNSRVELYEYHISYTKR